MQKKIKECIKGDVTRNYALVAQLDRASDYGSEGCEFESRRARHKLPPERAVFFVDIIISCRLLQLLILTLYADNL